MLLSFQGPWDSILLTREGNLIFWAPEWFERKLASYLFVPMTQQNALFTLSSFDCVSGPNQVKLTTNQVMETSS